MNAKQEFLFGMLKEIDGICKRNDVQYFIVAGTLIGAVRNGGFLPWDDDIDVVMTYDNFLKFQEACKTDIPENRMVCTPYEDESYPTLFPRYISTNTTCIHSSQTLHDDVAGELIDIFILDPIADGPEATQRQNEIVCLTHDMGNYASVLSCRFDVSFEEYEKYEAIKREKGKLAACQALEDERVKLFDEDGSRYMHRSLKAGVLNYPRSWFESSVDVMFEGYPFPAPVAINNYLTQLYGKEWTELPSNINPAKHDTSASLNFPYTEALAYYHPSCDRDELREKMFERKHNVIEGSSLANGLSDDVARVKAKAAQLELEHHLAQYQDQFDKAYENRDTVELGAILADYMAAQGDRSVIGRYAYDDLYRYRKPVLVDVSDKVFEASLLVYMERRQLTRASRLLTIRERQGLALTEPMRQAKEAIASYTDAVNCCQVGDWNGALSMARAIWEAFPGVNAFLRLTCACLQKLKEDDAAFADEFKNLVEQGREKFPNDGFFLKLQGDTLCEEGDKEAGFAAYLVAAESMFDGLSLADIQNKTGYAPAWMRNSEWGKLYGVPQWDGPTPEKLDVPLRTSSIPRAKSVEQYLYDLLCELADLCESNGVAYSLDKDTATALITHGRWTDKLDGYAIVCDRKALEKLQGIVGTDPSALRCIEPAPAGSCVAARFHGRDSVCVKMRGKGLSALNDLHINILQAPKPQSGSKVSRGLRNLRNKLFGASFAANATTMTDKITGRKFKVVSGWEKMGVKPGASLKSLKNVVISTALRDDELLATGVVPNDFFKRWAKAQKNAALNKEAQAQFKKNFAEIKTAITLKKIADDLLPKKEQLLQLKAAGENEKLAKAMTVYLKFLKKHGCGEASCFDEELLEVAKTLL